MNKSIDFIEKVPWRSPTGPLINFKSYFTNKKVCDLGCGSGDILLYIQNTFKCKKLIGIDDTKRAIANINKHKLDIKVKTDMLSNIPYNFDTYYIWIETPNTECKVLELLKKNKSINNNKKYNIIIAYNTSGSCKNNPNIPNSTKKFNNICGFCNYLKCITGKMSIIERFLNSNNYLYTKKSYNYNDGLSCRESGEFTYYIITL